MMLVNGLKQLFRTPLRTLLFFLLIVVTCAAISVGGILIIQNRRALKAYENNFITVGTVEQLPAGINQIEGWNADLQDYQLFQRPDYNQFQPLSMVSGMDFEFIQAPEQRPFYYSDASEYELPDYGSGLVNGFVEFTPLEDCIPDHRVKVRLTKIVWGFAGIMEGTNIEIYARYTKQPEPIYADKTYLAYIADDLMRNDAGEFIHDLVPRPLTIMQYDAAGQLVKNDFTEDKLYYEVTEDFYQTQEGKMVSQYIKGAKRDLQAIPVVGTNQTILIMPFYKKDAYVYEGRDISAEEYDAGDQVCLVPKDFAKVNGLAVGGFVHVRLYAADYKSAVGTRFIWGGGQGLSNSSVNAEGQMYPVFWDADYRIVGLYDLTVGADSNYFYAMGLNEVIVPAKSIRQSDENNIINYGPMKGYNTSFQIENGRKEEFMKEWEQNGSEELEIVFYDGGYSKLEAGMKNMGYLSAILLGTGVLMLIFLLLFFSYIYITRQKKQIAIERSLGMGKKKCMRSMLFGIFLILLLGSSVGSGIGGVLAGNLSAQNLNRVYYDDRYSNGVGNSEESEEAYDDAGNTTVVVTCMLSIVAVVSLGMIISANRMSRVLKLEPMKLLTTEI